MISTLKYGSLERAKKNQKDMWLVSIVTGYAMSPGVTVSG